MLVGRLIEVLQEQVEGGYLKLDDDLVVDWFSYDDVNRVAGHYDTPITDDEARSIWAECVEEIDNFDTYDVEVINNCIGNTVSLYMEQKEAK
jgi:hypothetical protein